MADEFRNHSPNHWPSVTALREKTYPFIPHWSNRRQTGQCFGSQKSNVLSLEPGTVAFKNKLVLTFLQYYQIHYVLTSEAQRVCQSVCWFVFKVLVVNYSFDRLKSVIVVVSV